MNYRQVIQDLEKRVIMPERPPSLVPMREAVEKLKFSYDPKRVVVVAGTNGKGTVSATLAKLIEQSGARVGLYTSPHLVDTRERIQINNEPISEEKFCQSYLKIRSLTGQHLSHFEMLTLMALDLFIEQNCDWMIFEVGLGGVWDATNAVEHNTSIICQLGFDHQDILGDSLWGIAKNKLGIIRDNPSHQVIYQKMPAEIHKLFEGWRSDCQAKFVEAANYPFSVEETEFEPRYFLNTPFGRQRLNLHGARAAQNSSIALTAFANLGFDPAKHLSALANVNWPGRLNSKEIAGRRVFLSGDHNPQGVDSLKEILKHFHYENLWCLVGIGKAKDADRMLEKFLDLRSVNLILTETPFRGLTISQYGDWLNRCEYYDKDYHQALTWIFERSGPRDLILVSGSLYLVGAILNWPT